MIKIVNNHLSYKAPVRYIVFNRDQIHDILSENPQIRTIDQIKMPIFNELLNDGLTINDIMHLFDKHGIDYQARRMMTKIQRTVTHIHEFPEKISFVTQYPSERNMEWDCKYNIQEWV